MRTTTGVHGYEVVYENSQKYTSEGISYLNGHLSKDEVKPFFDEAKTHASAKFEDRQNHNFIITYANGEYVLASLSQ